MSVTPSSTIVNGVEEPEAPKVGYKNGSLSIVPLEEFSDQVAVEEEGKPRKTPWTHEEEEMLARSWLFVSQSQDTSTKYPQLNIKIWKRACEYYNKNKKLGYKRKLTNLKAQWHYINGQVHDFNEIFIQLKNKNHNGFCDHQLKEAALEVYYNTCKKNFRYEHVWNMVKNEPKWRATNTAEYAKRKPKIVASGLYPSSSDAQMSNNLDDNVVEVHPICYNVAKRKEKMSNGADNNVDEVHPACQNAAKRKEKSCNDLDSNLVEIHPHNGIGNNVVEIHPGNDHRNNVVEVHPVYQNGAKRKEKTKVTERKGGGLDETSAKFHRENMKLMRKYMESMDTRNKVDESLLKIKEERLKMEEIQCLFKDTSFMTDEQLEIYRNYCKKIRAKYDL